jgi:hypothetical protein
MFDLKWKRILACALFLLLGFSISFSAMAARGGGRGSGGGSGSGGSSGSGSGLGSLGLGNGFTLPEVGSSTEETRDGTIASRLDYETLQTKLLARIDTVITKLENAIAAIDDSLLVQGTKDVLTAGLEDTISLLEIYRSQAETATTFEALQQINEEAVTYLASQKDVIRTSVQAGMEEIAANTIDRMQDVSEKTTESLCKLWVSCPENREEIERLLSDVSVVSETLDTVEEESLSALESQLLVDLKAKDMEAIQADVETYAALAKRIVGDIQVVYNTCMTDNTEGETEDQAENNRLTSAAFGSSVPRPEENPVPEQCQVL